MSVRSMRGGNNNERGLQELVAQLPSSPLVGIEIGSYAGESAKIMLDSGKFSKLTCIDPWVEEWTAGAEAAFDARMGAYAEVEKVKGFSYEVVDRFENESVDFIYIDGSHTYEAVFKDIKLFYPKLKKGGYIAGHDFSGKFPGVIKAVFEHFDKPMHVFSDSSWLVRKPLPKDYKGEPKHEIINYTSSNIKKCLDLFLPTWKADKVTVYSDSEEFGEKLFEPATDWHENTHRKIQTILHALKTSKAKYITYLDTDCLMTDRIPEIWSNFNTDIVVTRMVHRADRPTGEKAINSGVIFFRRNKYTIAFVERWLIRARSYRGQPGVGQFHEQTAFSHLVYEAFDSLDDVSIGVVSERIYNLENDDLETWLKQIEDYEPKIIHFKARRWENEGLVKKVKDFVFN